MTCQSSRLVEPSPLPSSPPPASAAPAKSQASYSCRPGHGTGSARTNRRLRDREPRQAPRSQPLIGSKGIAGHPFVPLGPALRQHPPHHGWSIGRGSGIHAGEVNAPRSLGPCARPMIAAHGASLASPGSCEVLAMALASTQASRSACRERTLRKAAQVQFSV